MKKSSPSFILIIICVALFGVPCSTANACTNFLITKGASADGSTMITYSADSHEFYGDLSHLPPGIYMQGAMHPVIEWDSGKYLGQIPEAPRTYGVVGLMNEHQVAIGETTFGGRNECHGGKGILDYGSLMFIALQRAKTAREAIKIIGDLTAEHGYVSTGESLSVSDPNEVWIMEIIGKGPDNKGAVWVALRVPDGYVCAHANQSRIRQFPLNDPENCLYAPDVISFAKEKGFYKGEDKDFSFADTYAPLTYGALRFCEVRVWEMFNRVASSLKISSDYVKGVLGSQPLPLWIKPDKKLSVHDVMELMRDHFEGTEFDLTKDIGAGPFQCPYRWRPLTWKVNDVEYLNERATSTQQTGFSFVAQSRAWLPDPIGGILWFGVDDTYSTVYVPMYCGISEVPKSYSKGNGSLYDFTWDAAFWVFNWVANFAYSRYSDMIQDIQVVQREIEGRFINDQPEIEKAALELYKRSPRLAVDYLTDYSVKQGNIVVDRWRKLGQDLLVKYMDGNVKTPQRKPTHPGYPESWYRRIVEDNGEELKMKKLPGEPEESH
ncbi:MAG: C69 family dipeptidase [Acidobacteriota bacterium]